MSDGAHLGVKPKRALQTILGGEAEPGEDERMDVLAMRDWLLAAPDPSEPSYDGQCRAVARWILEHLQANPQRARLTGYELSDVLKAEDSARYERVLGGITGFMYGWSENAARRCLELPPQANPAILTLGSEEDSEDEAEA